MTSMSTTPTSISSLSDFLQDPLAQELLLDPVTLSCCERPLNYSTAIQIYGPTREDGNCAATNIKCSFCMRKVEAYFKNQGLKRAVEIICGLINHCEIQSLNIYLNRYFIVLSLKNPSASLSELNSLINEVSLMYLQNNMQFQEQLARSCCILTVDEIRASNPTPNDPLVLPQGLVMIADVPNSFIDTSSNDAQENVRNIFYNIFSGKIINIDYDHKSECSLELTQRDQNLTLVFIRSTQEMRFAIEDNDQTSPIQEMSPAVKRTHVSTVRVVVNPIRDVTTSLTDLYKLMFKENCPYLVKPGQSLTLINNDPEDLKKILQANQLTPQESELRWAQFLNRYTEEGKCYLWNFNNCSILPCENDPTGITLIPSEEVGINCILQDYPTHHFSAASFVEFLKSKDNTFSLTGPRRLIFTFAKPVQDFCENASNENEIIINILEYLGTLAGKALGKFKLNGSVFQVTVGNDFISIFFDGEAIFSFLNALHISKNFDDLFAQMQSEQIPKITLKTDSTLRVFDTASSFEEIMKSRVVPMTSVFNIPPGCSMSAHRIKRLGLIIIREKEVIGLTFKDDFYITAPLNPTTTPKPPLISHKKTGSQTFSRENSSMVTNPTESIVGSSLMDGASSSESSSMTITTTESTVESSFSTNKVSFGAKLNPTLSNREKNHHPYSKYKDFL